LGYLRQQVQIDLCLRSKMTEVVELILIKLTAPLSPVRIKQRWRTFTHAQNKDKRGVPPNHLLYIRTIKMAMLFDITGIDPGCSWLCNGVSEYVFAGAPDIKSK